MKASRTTFILLILGASAVFVAGFCLGGMYSSGRAVKALNQLSIAEDTGIKDAIEKQDDARASKIADGAVNAHLDYLRSWSNPPLLDRVFYLVPWTGPSESETRVQLH